MRKDVLVCIAIGIAVLIVVGGGYLTPNLAPAYIPLLTGLCLIGFGLRSAHDSPGTTFGEFMLGNMKLRLDASVMLILLGLATLGYTTFLSFRVTWTRLISAQLLERAVEEQLSHLIPREYRALLLKEEHRKVELPEEKKHLNAARNRYSSKAWEDCLKLLEEIQTTDPGIIEDALYYKMMATFHLYQDTIRMYGSLSKDEVEALKEQFARFVSEHRESRWYSDIKYFRGHVYLQLEQDQDAALAVFDDIVENEWQSKWIQGSLYYSAVLHYQKGTDSHRKVAVRNMRRLHSIDHLVKLIEIDREVDAAGVAERILREWEVPLTPGKVPE